MADTTAPLVLRHVHMLVRAGVPDEPSDAMLLQQYLRTNDAAAFEFLVKRHGRMVLGVCRRILRHLHDAEDAFQAVFLILSKKASAIRGRDSLAGWLHRVAYRVSLTALRQRARFEAASLPETVVCHPVVSKSAEQAELTAVLDGELQRLPKQYRIPLIRCYLQQYTLEEVAAELDCPIGTVASRLARGRAKLLQQFLRRGVTLTVGAVPAFLVGIGRADATQPLPRMLADSLCSPKILALSQGALKTMMWMKARTALFATCTILGTLVGGGVLWHQLSAQADEAKSAPTREVPAEKAKAPAVDTAMGLEWPVFRGNAEQSGVAEVKLPEKFKLLWKFSAKDSVDNAVAIVKGTVYAGSYDEHLYAIDLQKGELKWKTKLGTIKASPCVKGDRVYVGDIEGTFYCLDAAKGEVIWKYKTEGEISSGCNFVEDHILIGSHDETLYCLNQKGEKVWEFKTQGPVNGSPAVANGKTFVAGCDSDLHVIDVKTGKEDFKIALDGQAGATAAVKGDLVYVGTMNNEVVAIDLVKRKVEWRYSAAKRQQAFYASAAVTNDLVVVGSRDRKIHAIDRKKGTTKWEFLTDGRVDSSPLVVGKRVFVGSLDKTFYILDLEKGEKIDSFDLDGGIASSPAVAEGKVIIGTDKGTIYCFGE